jgi:hypothetical protein
MVMMRFMTFGKSKIRFWGEIQHAILLTSHERPLTPLRNGVANRDWCGIVQVGDT